MIVAMVLVSAVVGLLAVAGMVASAVPLWISLLAYPAVGSLTLLFTAALWNIRTSQTRQSNSMVRAHS